MGVEDAGVEASTSSNLQHNDGESEEGQRLDEHEAENHRCADGTGSAGIAGHAFASGRGNSALTERPAESGEGHAEPSGDNAKVLATCGTGLLSEQSGSNDEHNDYEYS
jgi:hypothetical protein